MKIGDVYSAATQITTSGTQKTDGQTSGVRNRQAVTEATPRSDRSELSSIANLMSAATDTYSASRAERVAHLRSEFLAGRYQPDSGAISRAMIQSALVDSGR